MKTTIELPDDLINQVMLITNSKTKIDAIKRALESIIVGDQRKKMLNFRGKVDLAIDLDITRDRNQAL